MKSQQKIINNFEKKLLRLDDEEKLLQNEIIKYENLLNETNNKVKIIKIKQESLKAKNSKLKNEKNEFNKQNSEDNLDKLKIKLKSIKNDYKFFQLKNKKTFEILDNYKKTFNFESKQFNNKTPIENINEYNNDYLYKNNNDINNEENLNKIKKLYQENKDKENELAKNLSLYQEAIKKMNNGEKVNIKQIQNNILKIINKNEDKNNDINNKNNKNNKNNQKKRKVDKINNNFKLSVNNPYYTNSEENDSIISNKFNNAQFSQFTYILLKNFEAKKINYEKGKNDIIIPLTNYFDSINKNDKDKNENNNLNNNSDIQEKLNEKFCEIIKNIINCDNQNDINNLKIYFNAIYFEQVINQKNNNNNININLMTEYFLSLFNLIHEYTQKEEKIIKEKLRIKYNNQFTKLINLLKNYKSSENNNKSNKLNDGNNINNILNDYITIQQLKYILDKNTDIILKEKYIEYIVYKMKQYNDNKLSLFDLKISKLDKILKEEIIEKNKNINSDKNKVNEGKLNESTKEISLEEYNNNINSVLVVVKQLMIDENKEFRQLFGDSIVKIENSNNDIIVLESLINELDKRNITLNNLQITCINKKYCINEELHYLDIKKIEEDTNNFKKK